MTVDKDAASDAALVDEIFASDRDRGADSAAPEPSVTPPPEVKAEAPAKVETKTEKVDERDDDDGSSKQYRDPETGRFVPLTELKTERTKRQEEARLRTEAETRAARAEAALEEARRLWTLQQQPQQHFQSQPQQPEPTPDDFWQDPNRFLTQQLQAQEQRIRAQIAQERVLERIEETREQMIAAHKDFEEMETAFVEAAQNAPHLLQAMARSRNPAKFAYDTAKRLRFLSDVGQEPEAYVNRVREEERKKVLEELKLGPQQTQRFPGTLSDAPAAGVQGRVLSDAAIADEIFASDRRRRARS